MVRCSVVSSASAWKASVIGPALWRTAFCSTFSSARVSRAASACRMAVSTAGVMLQSSVQRAARGFSQKAATTRRKNGPAWVDRRRRGWAPYCSLLVRFRSSIRLRIFSHWVQMPPAFCLAAAGRGASRCSCSAQPRISASGVRISWLTPAIHWVRASSRRARSSFRACGGAAARWFRSAFGQAPPQSRRQAG